MRESAEPPHGQLFHHSLGSPVSFVGERDNAIEPDRVETVRESRARSLGSQPLVPKFARHPPTDFDTGSEEGFEYQVDHSHHASELTSFPVFGGPEREAVLAAVSFDAVRESVALFACQRRGEVPHHLRIGIERSEWFAVFRLPIAKQQSGRDDHVPRECSAGSWRNEPAC